MKIESRVWQALNLIAIVLSGLIPAYMAMYGTKHSTEKRLESSEAFAINLVAGLSSLGSRASLSLTLDGKPINNIAVSNMTLTNTGEAPIVPSDFYERLAINVQKPWEILLVEAHDPPVSSVWHRVNDQKFEADPMLINPADTLRVSVYLTNMDVDRPTQDQINASVPTWSTHIMNLRSITVNKNILSEEAQRMWGVTITLYGWSLVITLVLSILFMAEYVHLLYETRIKSSKQWVVVVWLVVVGFLSVAASESIATYVAPTLMLRLTGISALINVPFIAANLFMLVYLWWEAYLARTKRGIVP